MVEVSPFLKSISVVARGVALVFGLDVAFDGVYYLLEHLLCMLIALEVVAIPAVAMGI